MQTAAVLPALGIGDALLMMIASHQLKMKDYQVTTYHDALPGLKPWLPGHAITPLPPNSIDALKAYDLVIVENDNSPKMKEWLEALRSRLSIFYPTYLPSKHAPLTELDRVFNPNVPMADNIAEAIASLIDLPALSKNNGLTPPSALSFRCQKKQVLIHPTSRELKKNWKPAKFIDVALQLKKRGMQPLFCVSPQERMDWEFVEKEGCALIAPPTLASLAAVVYEAGFVIGNDSLIGHLASNLNIPTLIIANEAKRMRLWRPGWLKGELVLPPPYIPNWKPLRMRETHWQHFISKAQVLRSFKKLAFKHSCGTSRLADCKPD